MTVSYCVCGHAAQVHTRGRFLQDSPERGVGPCTVNRCPCDEYSGRKR